MKRAIFDIEGSIKRLMIRFIVYGGLMSLCVEHFRPYLDPIVSICDVFIR